MITFQITTLMSKSFIAAEMLAIPVSVCVKAPPRNDFAKRIMCQKFCASKYLLIVEFRPSFCTKWLFCLQIFFFSNWAFFHEHLRITGLQWKGEGISLTPHYHFHPLHRHLGISRAVPVGSSPLHIATSRTRTGNLWFPSASG